MLFDKENEKINLDDLLENIPEVEKNMYIADENKAIELISQLIPNTIIESKTYDILKNKIDFILMSISNIVQNSEYQKRFINLYSKLFKLNKILKLENKVFVSLGGKVSAGKSKFINSISGIEDLLPIAQKATTAIPTYIIESEKDEILSNSIYGDSTVITAEALNAMAHEFSDTYNIGFSSLVDSIIIQSKNYTLSSKIALLDTPGYTKYDGDNNAKTFITDKKKAFDQLSVSDYLIWLIDIDGGTITQDDIEFIESLNLKSSILIVFTKADLKSESEIEQIIKYANETILSTNINCFGITAYSSNLKKEYFGNYIYEYFKYAVENKNENLSITEELRNLKNDIENTLRKESKKSKDIIELLYSYILKSEDVLGISSIVKMLSKEFQRFNNIKNVIFEIDKQFGEIEYIIDKITGREV